MHTSLAGELKLPGKEVMNSPALSALIHLLMQPDVLFIDLHIRQIMKCTSGILAVSLSCKLPSCHTCCPFEH